MSEQIVAEKSTKLSVEVLNDEDQYMAKCPELNLFTTFPTAQEAKEDLVDLVVEYAKLYETKKDTYLNSPNRAHHYKYVRRVLSCSSREEVEKLLGI